MGKYATKDFEESEQGGRVLIMQDIIIVYKKGVGYRAGGANERRRDVSFNGTRSARKTPVEDTVISFRGD